MMGLLDMYLNTGNEEALDIVLKCADWFYDFTNDISRETMSEMMSLQETGGMMHHFANLYAVTKDPRHLELVRRYERPHLFDPISRGEDVLTNMHMNATVPEVLGAARAYEVTGEERYFTIVKNYWDLAVTKRGTFATGGQSSGELYTPMMKQAARLGHMTQEHCTVYHMMQLADFLFRHTSDRVYADYIEKNLYNGILAQGYYESNEVIQATYNHEKEQGLISYYLPLRAGSRKVWGRKLDDFWCCHCTLLQANAIHHTMIYYQDSDGKGLHIAQYLPSTTEFAVGETKISLEQKVGIPSGEIIRILPEAYTVEDRPSRLESHFKVPAHPASLRFPSAFPRGLPERQRLRSTARRSKCRTTETASVPLPGPGKMIPSSSSFPRL